MLDGWWADSPREASGQSPLVKHLKLLENFGSWIFEITKKYSGLV
jgi:hypothetical protein